MPYFNLVAIFLCVAGMSTKLGRSWPQKGRKRDHDELDAEAESDADDVSPKFGVFDCVEIPESPELQKEAGS